MSDSLTEWSLADSTDVTLVSDDTYWSQFSDVTPAIEDTHRYKDVEDEEHEEDEFPSFLTLL